MPEQSGKRDELERALAALAPRRADVDRDRLMYQAGRAAAAARYRPWLWLSGSLTAAAGGVSLLLALVLAFAPRPVRIVTIPVPAPQAAPPAGAVEPLDPPGADVEAEVPPLLMPYSYGRLHQVIVRHGPDALPEPAPMEGAPPEAPAPPLSVWDWRSRSVDGSFLHARGDE